MDVLEISFKVENDKLTVFPKGRLITDTAQWFLDRTEHELCSDPNIKKLTIDLSLTDYVSSSGLRAFLALKKKLGEDMEIIEYNEYIWKVFNDTGFLDILGIK